MNAKHNYPRSYILEAYTAGLVSALALVIFGYQFARVAEWITTFASLGAPRGP